MASNVNIDIDMSTNSMFAGGSGGPGKIVSLDDFQSITKDILNVLAIDAGMNFLEGASTVASGIGGNATDTENVMNNLDASMDMTGSVMDIQERFASKDVGGELSNIAEKLPDALLDITTVTITKIGMAVTDMIVDSTGEILDPAPIIDGITYYTTYYLQVCTEGADKLLQGLMSSQDEMMKNALEDADSSDKDKKIAEIQKKLNDMKEKTAGIVDKAKGGVEMVTSYIENGPDWVVDQLNSYCGFALGEAQKYVDYGVDYVTSMRDQYIQYIGELIGTKLAATINDSVKKNLEKQLSLVKIQAKTIIMKAMCLLMTAVQIIVALLGPMLGKLVKMGVQMGLKALQDQLSF